MQPVPDFIKENIITKLKTVDLTKVNGYTLGIKLFLTDIEKRTDSDYLDLIKYLQAYWKANAAQCRQVLGNEAFIYFAVENLIAMECTRDIARKIASWASSFSGIRVIPNFNVGAKMHEPFNLFKSFSINVPGEKETAKDDLITKVGAKYEAVKDDLNSLLSTMLPVDKNFNLKSFNLSIEKVYQGIRDLRDLACCGSCMSEMEDK